MKNLVKIGCVMVAVLAFASCGKTGLDSVVPASATNQEHKMYHDGDGIDASTGSDIGTTLFTDKDKCKKCHGGTTVGKSLSMEINWDAPYSTNAGVYNTIEELINNYDFVNNVHLPKNAALANKVTDAGITTEQKQQLIIYLKGLAVNHRN